MESNEQRETAAASFKAFMMTNSTQSNTNLYDHLTRLLLRLMDERPNNAVDVLEDMSLELKRGSFEGQQCIVGKEQLITAAEQLAEQQRQLFSAQLEAEQDELIESAVPNVSEMGFYLEQAGVGLGREEMIRILLALKKLVDSQALLRCRFWGKVLGTENNYIVAESEYRDGEEEQEKSSEEVTEEEEREEEEEEVDPLPQSTYKPPPAVPPEAPGSGANRFVYYVCREPGLPWVKLPAVTPAQITAARHICKLFTGRLDAPVLSYPPFPGNEANYLRAQIARISAGTQVSPQGFFQLGEEEGDEEDEGQRDSYEVNPDFEPIPVVDMVESLSSWCHHTQHILQQGRCSWVNPAGKSADDSNEDGDAEDKEDEPEESELEPEVGPPLLTPLSQDIELFHTPPWTSKVSSSLTSQHAVAVLRSNLWPGAHAYACGKRFENIYIGWGVKYTGEGYSPPVPPPPQTEHPSGADITESLDPSVEEEQQQREAEEEEEEQEQEDMDDMDEDDEEDDD